MQDDIGKFWVVIKPDERSKVHEILFYASVADLLQLTMGGLRPSDVRMITTELDDAEIFAKELIVAARASHV